MSYFKKVLCTLRDCARVGQPSRLRDVDVVIHIGAPKTGSSAIQRFCFNNRKALLKAGFYYPKHRVDKNGVSGGHSVLARQLRNDHLIWARLYFYGVLLLARMRGATLLLSSESFCRNASRFAPLLEGLNVRIVGWFRHPIEAFVSNYNQSIKRHFNTGTISELFEKLPRRSPPAYLSGKRLGRWADVVGDDRCTFLPYLTPAENVEHIPMERTWLKVIGVPNEDMLRFELDAKRVNRSYMPDALELKRLMNVVLEEGGRQDSRTVDWALQSYSDNVEEREVDFGAHLEPEHVRRLNTMFGRSNRQLAKRFPSMKPLLRKDELYLRQAQSSENQVQDLSAVLAHLETHCPDVLERIRTRVKQRVAAEKAVSDELEALAGWIIYRGERFQ